MKTPRLNNHAKFRAAQRNVSIDAITYIKTYGQCFHKAGAKIHYLRYRDIPEWDRPNDQLARLAGTAVILTKDGRTVLTVWRNRRTGLKHIKQKPDHSYYAD